LEFNRKGFQLLFEAMAEARKGKDEPAEQIRAMGRAYWDFAFKNKEYYQLMFGLGIPTCEAVSKIPAIASYSEEVIGSIIAMVEPGKKPSFDPFLKYQSFWSMLHGLVSINMSALGGCPDAAAQDGGEQGGLLRGEHGGLPLQVLEDVICSFIRGIQASETERKD
jgi:hypothetical protein